MSSNTWSKSMNGMSTYSRGSIRQTTDDDKFDFWGDKNCDNHSLRVGFINIQTFPTSIHHHKNNNIRNLFHDYKLSILGLSEVNLHWPALSHDQQLIERTQTWFERVTSFTSCNVENTRMKNQRGGTAIIANGDICSSTYGYTSDKLGRWTVLTFRGKDGVNLHTI